MWIIISLIIIGVLLLVAELVLLPGMSVAGFGALASFGVAVYMGFSTYGTTGGIITIAAIIILSVVATILSLRAKTWQRLSLKNEIDGTSQPLPQNELKIGDKGTALTRLGPIGKIDINNKTYEARSLGDSYVDPLTNIEVVGFENFTVIVRITAER